MYITLRLPLPIFPLMLAIPLLMINCSDLSPSEEPAPAVLDSLVRTTAQGAVRGTLWDGETLAWLGVPYAAAPVAGFRWKAPREPEPWEGERSAEAFSDPCSQLGGFLGPPAPDTFGKPLGSEDCLYLNIWRPAAGEERLPVFVYVHGGMNSVGQASTGLYHGAHLAGQAGAVVVTINYRLGPLGFFFHKSLESGDPRDDSGNYGLLDIIQALAWIQSNIDAFGGDPDKVTVGGESAGAFNVCSLLGTPLAKGLFHGAFAISPAGTTTTGTPDQAHKAAEDILVRLVQSDGTLEAPTASEARRYIRSQGNAWAARYLRDCSPTALLNSSVRFSSLGTNEIGLLVLQNRTADGTVIPVDFKERLEQGRYNQVPLLIGSNTQEYKMFLFTGILPPKFIRQDEHELFQIIRTFDPGNTDLSLSDFIDPGQSLPYEVAGTFLGRLMFDASIEDLVSRLVPHQDVFVYSFAWNKQPAPFDRLLGSGHMMAIPFFFGNFSEDTDNLFRIAWSPENRSGCVALSEIMMSYLANFLHTGDPNSGPFAVALWSPSNRQDQPAPMRFDAPE